MLACPAVAPYLRGEGETRNPDLDPCFRRDKFWIPAFHPSGDHPQGWRRNDTSRKMPIPKSLLNFLDKNKIKYEIIKHRVVFTALDKAATLKLKPQEVAKSVVVGLDKKDRALALIPANKNLDKKKLLKLINKQRQKNKLPNYKKIDFADEKWMKTNLKGIKVGATPAFGIFYKLPTFIDNALLKPTKLIINAGDYEYSLKISPSTLFKTDPMIIKGGFSQTKK